MKQDDASAPLGSAGTVPLSDEYTRVYEAVALKSKLLALGVDVEPGIAGSFAINASRRHLYDYGSAVPSFEIPYELVLARIPAFNALPVTSRVRYRPDSPLKLVVESGAAVIIDGTDGSRVRPIEVPALNDFRELKVGDIPLASVVQRLGYDLLGLVPTNFCSYYAGSEQCRFCEIVETFEANHSYPRFRKPQDLLVEAADLAASSDPTISSITFNGGQLHSYDGTARMYVQIMTAVRRRSALANLDATIALMPPSDLRLIDELKASGLNQLFLNVEVLQPDLLQAVAPGKAKYGIDRMLEAMEYAVAPFGSGRVYSNLVYGIQSLPTDLATSDWDPTHEHSKIMEACESLLSRGIVPTHTIYHTAGYSKVGPIQLDADALQRYTVEYGRLVWSSGLIQRDRGAILFSIGSLPNTTYNDGWLLAELEARVSEQGTHATAESSR